MIEKLDHLAIAVWSIDESLPYYTGQLKLALVHDERLAPAGVRLAYLDAGNTLIQLVEPIGETPVHKHLQENGEGLHHLCFGVARIPSALQELEGERDVRIVPGGRGRRACFLGSRPNGVAIELTERDPVSVSEVSDS